MCVSFSDDACLALGLGDDLVGVGLGLVDGALLVLLNGDIPIGGDDLLRASTDCS